MELNHIYIFFGIVSAGDSGAESTIFLCGGGD
jgi:hypothetical protein